MNVSSAVRKTFKIGILLAIAFAAASLSFVFGSRNKEAAASMLPLVNAEVTGFPLTYVPPPTYVNASGGCSSSCSS